MAKPARDGFVSPSAAFAHGRRACGARALRRGISIEVVDACPTTMPAQAFESYREIRSESAARLVLRLTRGGRGAVKQAGAWLVEHSAWLTPLLERWAGGDDHEAALAAAGLAVE